MAIDELKHVLSPPPTPTATGTDAAFEKVESSLRVSLPEDYKAFISQYGIGCIDEFIWVFNPFTDNQHLNLLTQRDIKLDALRVIRDEFREDVPFPLFPADRGLFPWGETDNGDVLYWQCIEGCMQPRVIVGESRGPGWQEFDGTMTEFLAALLARRYVVDFFPDEFPSDYPTFVTQA